MAKILKDKDLGEIISSAVNDPGLIDCSDAYHYFLEDLSDLVCRHFGGRRGPVIPPDEGFDWMVGFHADECLPADGGVFKPYHREVTWKNGEEL